MATNFTAQAKIEAPLEDAWRVMKHPVSERQVGFGIEEISFEPDNQPLQGGMEVYIKMGRSVLQNLPFLKNLQGDIVFLVEEVDDEEHLIVGSVVEAPKGITGTAKISLNSAREEGSNLHFHGEFESVPLKLQLGLAALKRVIDSKLMPWVGHRIAKKSLKSKHATAE